MHTVGHKTWKGVNSMAVMKSVENGVQAKSVIETFEREGYHRNHIHIFAHSDKRAEDLANFFNVDAGASGESNGGFFESIKNLFKDSSNDLDGQLSGIGLNEHERTIAHNDLNDGKLVIVAHNPM